MSDIIPVTKPLIRADWKFETSVEMVRPILGRWKTEAKEMIIPELWNAHEHLAGRKILKSPTDTGKAGSRGDIRTFAGYCEAIGISDDTGRSWLYDANLLQKALVTKHTGNQENYTPKVVIDAVRNVLGDIDLDPASCPEAQEIVQAGKYFTEEDNGLDSPWFGRVFLNPPYQHPTIKEFTDKLISELPHIQSAILLTNNNTDTQWFVKCAMNADLMCLTTGRINFYTSEIEKTMPTNGQAFFYFGDNPEAFAEVFKDRGLIVKVIDGDL